MRVQIHELNLELGKAMNNNIIIAKKIRGKETAWWSRQKEKGKQLEKGQNRGKWERKCGQGKEARDIGESCLKEKWIRKWKKRVRMKKIV
jgi:hypothetical protein